MVIGIAGGVGSGKSTALAVLEKEYGAYLCMADELGHLAMVKGTESYDRIVAEFGTGILTEQGDIDRNRLAQVVYADGERLEVLNAVIHPFVKREIRRQMEQYGKKRLFVLETAILFETGCQKFCDEVWGIVTDDEIRIRRLMESRGYTREKAENIMKKQMSNEELERCCGRVIRNEGTREELAVKIRRTVENILEK